MLQDLNPAILSRAADYFADVADSPTGSASADPVAAEFLRGLGYMESASDARKTPNRLALLRAAARFERLFVLSAPRAPGLALFGAVVRPDSSKETAGSVTGSGTGFGHAFESCIGEGVEFLSQFEYDGDRIASPSGGAVVDAFPEADGAPESSGEAIAATDLRSGAEVLLPFERCIRPHGAAGLGQGPFVCGTGCGAGESFAAAALHGLYELIERDAAALWWWGRSPGRPLSVETQALRDAADFLASLRLGVNGRASWFLDLTTDTNVPTVAAVSADGNGEYVACGTASRATLGAALQAAIREMCQMELAYDVVCAKLAEGGEASLNTADRRHLGRVKAINAKNCSHLHPSGAPRVQADLDCGDGTSESVLQAVVTRLEAAGATPYAVDLTRPVFGIPVVRAVVPQLQLYPSVIVAPRLRKCLEEAGKNEPLYPLH